METSLWDWQDEAAEELRRAGKHELADLWDDLGNVVEDLDALRAAARLARELDEPRWELFYQHWTVQQGLFRQLVPIQQLEDAGRRLSELTHDPATASCPQRFCASESLCNLGSSADPPGHAEEVIRTADRLAGQIPEQLECRWCFVLLRAGALIELGRLDEAERMLAPAVDDELDDNIRLLARAYLAEVAEARGDGSGMLRQLQRCREIMDQDGSVNPDNEWFVLELEVRTLVLAGDLSGAAERVSNPPVRPPETSAEWIRIELAVARGYATRSQWSEARSHAEVAARLALRRGMVRFAAEGSLLAAEACRELDSADAAAAHGAGLGNLLVQLTSRDLDARARVVGARW